jgi:hypothetical protein
MRHQTEISLSLFAAYDWLFFHALPHMETPCYSQIPGPRFIPDQSLVLLLFIRESFKSTGRGEPSASQKSISEHASATLAGRADHLELRF